MGESSSLKGFYRIFDQCWVSADIEFRFFRKLEWTEIDAPVLISFGFFTREEDVRCEIRDLFQFFCVEETLSILYAEEEDFLGIGNGLNHIHDRCESGSGRDEDLRMVRILQDKLTIYIVYS